VENNRRDAEDWFDNQVGTWKQAVQQRHMSVAWE
jgi:hypothetical protein